MFVRLAFDWSSNVLKKKKQTNKKSKKKEKKMTQHILLFPELILWGWFLRPNAGNTTRFCVKRVKRAKKVQTGLGISLTIPSSLSTSQSTLDESLPEHYSDVRAMLDAVLAHLRRSSEQLHRMYNWGKPHVTWYAYPLSWFWNWKGVLRGCQTDLYEAQDDTTNCRAWR